MAAALLGYFSTMVAALALSVVLLNGVLSSSLVHRTKPQPYPVPPVAELAAPEQQPSATQAVHDVTDEDNGATERQQEAAKKADRLEVARVQKRKEVALRKQKEQVQALARQHQPDSVALSYDQDDPPPSAPPIFNLFAARR